MTNFDVFLSVAAMRRGFVLVLFSVVPCQAQTNLALPVTHVVDVQLVQVTTDDGSEVATVFGTQTQRSLIEDRVNVIWSQCGIQVNFLPTINTFASDFVYDGRPTDYTDVVRPSSHLNSILFRGSSAGVANSGSSTVAAYFLGISPGFNDLGPNFVGGFARVDRNGTTLAVAPNLPTFSSGRSTVAFVFAHELGHNLGLEHMDAGLPNLLSEGNATSAQLAQSQCATVFTDDAGQDGFELLQAADLASCDFDGDGQCDLTDLDYYYRDGFGGDNARLNLDNSDGLNIVDELDLSEWLLQASDVSNPYKANPNDIYVLGDIDLDGSVDSQDLGSLLNNFNDTSGLNWRGGNLNSDSAVNSTDLGLLLNNFGHSAGTTAAVPEPNSLLLLAVACVLVCFRRRR